MPVPAVVGGWALRGRGVSCAWVEVGAVPHVCPSSQEDERMAFRMGSKCLEGGMDCTWADVGVGGQRVVRLVEVRAVGAGESAGRNVTIELQTVYYTIMCRANHVIHN